MEDYKVMTGEVRREWKNPSPEMLGWLDVHKVGVLTVLYDSEGYRVYKYNLDDGRRVWETFSISEYKTVLVAIEEEVENV